MWLSVLEVQAARDVKCVLVVEGIAMMSVPVCVRDSPRRSTRLVVVVGDGSGEVLLHDIINSDQKQKTFDLYGMQTHKNPTKTMATMNGPIGNFSHRDLLMCEFCPVVRQAGMEQMHHKTCGAFGWWHGACVKSDAMFIIAVLEDVDGGVVPTMGSMCGLSIMCVCWNVQ